MRCMKMFDFMYMPVDSYRNRPIPHLHHFRVQKPHNCVCSVDVLSRWARVRVKPPWVPNPHERDRGSVGRGERERAG